MFNISISALDALFANCFDKKELVPWVCGPNHQEQFFVGENFLHVWGHPVSVLYEDPRQWRNFLLEKERELVMAQVEKRMSTGAYDTLFYRVLRPDDTVAHIKDIAFYLVDQDERRIGFAGIAEQLTPEAWQTSRNQLLKQPSVSQLVENKLLEQPFVPPSAIGTNVSAHPFSERVLFLDKSMLILTVREKQCVECLWKGLTAKQTGQSLSLSQRTVEMYLEKVKEKMNCRTKLELMKLLHSGRLTM